VIAAVTRGWAAGHRGVNAPCCQLVDQRLGSSAVPPTATLYAISDLHVTHPVNRAFAERIQPHTDDDCLLFCGDISEELADVRWLLKLLSARWARVLWTPGNHELWTSPTDMPVLRGEHRYRHLVDFCRTIGVLTPEDEYSTCDGPGGPATVAPLFLLYDYTFGRSLAPTKAHALLLAERAGVVSTDEYLLHPDPYPTRGAWCRARLRKTECRLGACDPTVPTVLAGRFPLVAEQTLVLRRPEFAQWCGTTLTADWHRRFRATVVIRGHLHIPGSSQHDGVRFEEVSLGLPQEWHRQRPPTVPRAILRRES
jgi:Calcineurin-like phosphoesterase